MIGASDRNRRVRRRGRSGDDARRLRSLGRATHPGGDADDGRRCDRQRSGPRRVDRLAERARRLESIVGIAGHRPLAHGRQRRIRAGRGIAHPRRRAGHQLAVDLRRRRPGQGAPVRDRARRRPGRLMKTSVRGIHRVARRTAPAPCRAGAPTLVNWIWLVVRTLAMPKSSGARGSAARRSAASGSARCRGGSPGRSCGHRRARRHSWIIHWSLTAIAGRTESVRTEASVRPSIHAVRHDDERLALLVADVEDADDVGVNEAGRTPAPRRGGALRRRQLLRPGAP